MIAAAPFLRKHTLSKNISQYNNFHVAFVFGHNTTELSDKSRK